MSFNDEDILAYDLVTEQWELFIDSSDIGLNTDIDSVHVGADGRIFFGVTNPTTIAGFGAVDDSDILLFTPTSTGSNTAGTLELFFDGSDVGLTTDSEDVDAIGFTPDNRLVISTLGAVQVNGLSAIDEDLLVFNATTFGETTSGSWEQYFDGSDVRFYADVDGVSIASDSIALNTVSRFSRSGVRRDGSDIFSFTPSLLGPTTRGTFGDVLFDGSASGDIDAFSIVGESLA